MKQLLFLLCFSPLSLLAQQPAITFRAPQATSGKVKVEYPVDGKYFFIMRTDTALNQKGELVWRNTETTPSEFSFEYKGKKYTLFVKPGKSYTITDQGEGADRTFSITGPDAAAQEAFSRIKFPFYEELAYSRYRALDSSFANNEALLRKDIDSVMAPFKTLLAGKQMEQAFYDHVYDHVRAFYANVMLSVAYSYVGKAVPYKDSIGYDAAKWAQINEYFQRAFAIADPHDLRLQKVNTVYWYTFTNINLYLKYIKPAHDGTLVPFSPDEPEYQRQYDIVSRFRDPEREFQTANLLSFAMLQGSRDKQLLGWYETFNDMYPNNPYAARLAPGVAAVRDYQDKIAQDFKPGQKFLEDAASVNTIAELGARFKGKTIYLDLWASWCGPCKAEFAYTGDVKKFLAEKGGTTLYLSIDNEGAEKKWKEAIKYYNLEGYHLRASEKLSEDIRRQFGKNGSLSIPRYAIIKDGELVVNDAKRPSAGKALIDQLAPYF
ncbi:redoxin family protein [Chitinophaga horti]|uniref:Redoxin family protein n=1 Tax=Chitinophaga horti TaxID=2920382 RepID=A0ABY6J492_9BACT|nr:redoxin family protein [Chitinophaga horti]UYQ94491.1 redoxin family protein [Chitinophaga horti]